MTKKAPKKRGRKKEVDWVARAWKAAKTKERKQDMKRVVELVKELHSIFKKHKLL